MNILLQMRDLGVKLALAGQAHVYHFATEDIKKAGAASMMASGVVITITALGGREIVPPVLVRDGLSDATISALQTDFARSFELATIYKPKGK